jgi:hypothetical protein
MKKLLLLLLTISFLSTQSVAKTGDVYYCDELQHRSIFPSFIGENYDFEEKIFKFKLDKNNLILYTTPHRIKEYNAPEFTLYPIIYKDFEFLGGNEKPVEKFGAQNDFGTIIYFEDTFLEFSIGNLEAGINQPFMNVLRTATCKIY